MNYNYNFALGSVLFMGLTTIFYLHQRRIRDTKDHLYTIMLLGGLTAVLFDFAAALAESMATCLPMWLLYAVNFIFILGEQVCLPAFFFYFLVITGHYRSRSDKSRMLFLLPFFIVMFVTLCSLFSTWGIFYINADHAYRPGALHFLLYTASGLYILGSSVLFAANFKTIDKTRRGFIMAFVIMIVCAMVAQISFPTYLLVTPAAALALTGMYYVLRAPGEQVDPFTNAFCRTLLPELLQDRADKKRPCTLLLYTALNIAELGRSYGPLTADALMAALAEWLKTEYPRDTVVYMNDTDFTLITEHMLDEETLRHRRQSTPETLKVDGSEMPIKIDMAALQYGADSPIQLPLTTMDYLFRQMHDTSREELFLADEAFQNRCGRLALLEASMDTFIREGRTELICRPVRAYAEGENSDTAMLDISLGLVHDELRDITAEELLSAILQSGNIRWYYQRLITMTGELAKTRGEDTLFCLPLLPAILIQNDKAVAIFDMVSAAGIAPKRIVLRMLEEDAAIELPVVKDNINRLAAFGFALRLDEFAEGYTDTSLLGALPIVYVMIDESLVRNADNNPRSKALLDSVAAILRDIGKKVLLPM